MLRSSGRYVVAAVGLIVAALVPPDGRAHAEQPKPQRSINESLQGIETALDRLSHGDEGNKPCGQGKDDRNSDLCAQWKAADAAKESADYTRKSFFLGIVAAIIGGLTLAAAWQAARWARRAAEANVDAVKIARTALIGVERPILLLSMPREIPDEIASQLKMRTDKANYVVIAENIGRQTAIIFTVIGHYFIQTETTPPELFLRESDEEGRAIVFMTAEAHLPTATQAGFVAQRFKEITNEQFLELKQGTLYGFYRIGFVYADPVGTLRTSIAIFYQDHLLRGGAFRQILSKDTVLPEDDKQKNKDGQRKLIGRLIKAESMNVVNEPASRP